LQARKAGEGAAAASSAPVAAVEPTAAPVPSAVPATVTVDAVPAEAAPVADVPVAEVPTEAVAPARAPASSGAPDARATGEWPVVVPVGTAEVAPATSEARAEAAPGGEDSPVVTQVPDHGTTPTAEPVHVAPVEPAAPHAAAPAAPAGSAVPAGPSATSTDTAALTLRWPEVLETLSTIKRLTWMLVRDNAEVAELTESTLVLSFSNGGAAGSFRNGNNSAALQEAVHKTLGFQVRIDVQIDEGDGTPRARTTAGPAPTPSPQPAPGATPPAPSAPPLRDEASGGAAAPTGQVPGAGSVSIAPTAPQGAGAIQVSGGTAAVTDQRGGVALQERPVPASQPSTPEVAAASVVEPPVVNAADEAWLAGLPVTEPPADLDEGHEPPPADVRRAAPSGSGAVQRPAVPSAASVPPAPSAPTPAVPTGPAPGVRETRRQTLERQAAEQRARQSSARVTVSMDDDSPSDDDPDLASSGLVGAPLVAQLLGGVVIDETIDTGL
ncbi:hypothetical protein ACFRCR_15250, partial [Oerskovia sp. NPDC056781]